MTTAPRTSLRWLLVRRLVALQAMILATLTVVWIGAVWAGGFVVPPEAEDQTINAIRDAVARDESGGLTLRQTPMLARQLAALPEPWFLVRDKSGHSVSRGEVPAEFARIGDALDAVGQARLGWTGGEAPRGTARMRWVDAPGGKLQILAGAGGTVPFHRFAGVVAALLASIVLPVTIVMALATLIATPMVVRRSLAGLATAAAEAEAIDIDRRGTQLSLDLVPSEIVPLVRAVNDALRRLDEGLERRELFLANAAHEVRTPIAILQTRIESLEPGPQTDRLLEDVKRLSTLADQLLDVERIKQTAAPSTAVDLVDIARRVTADLAPLAIAAGYEIGFDNTVGHVTMPGDEGALERAIANLIQNAIQYGGRRGRILVRVSPTELSVSDEGPGVPPADRERVFEPFYRSSSGTRGAGLGLNLVREIARLHGGRVEIKDSPTGADVSIMFGARSRLRQA
ncbi:sensor histidine kinase [Rhodopseudomonas sp. NSM]|uniref:sensor histidine kinase n=1 Tax=Rhodopseudomonas sp. NSM TaxID=3457630 RepID=UPI0040359DB3